jgi:hypothetical protein
MAGLLFTNNASAALASSITTSSTTITVTTGAGAQFPGITGGNYFYATLTDSSNNLEIVKVTGRASDVLTVVRAQEGTTARAYSAADKIELRLTAAGMNSFAQLGLDNTLSGSNTFSGTNTFSGSNTFSGAVALTGAATAVTQSSGDNTTKIATTQFVTTGLQAAYPIGSIYISTVSTNPNTLFGFGTWVAFGTGRMLISQDGSTYTAGSTGGSSTSTIGTTNLPSHTHTFSGTTGARDLNHTHQYGSANNYGGGGPNSFDARNTGSYTTSGASVDMNHTHSFSGTTDGTGSGTALATISPYIAVYMWNRTV